MINFKVANKLNVGESNIVLLVGNLAEKTVIYNSFSGEIKKNIENIVKDNPALLKESNIEKIFLCNEGKDILKVVLVGLDDVKELTEEKVRSLAGDAVRAIKKEKMEQVSIFLPDEFANKDSFVKAFTEGICLGGYEFTQFKSKKSETLEFANNITLVVEDEKLVSTIEKSVQEGFIIAQNINFARDLINHPGNVVTPDFLANKAVELSSGVGLSCKVLEKQEMQQLGMRALLGVAQGSDKEPKLIVLEYKGKSDSKEKLAFVGKGVTFDSGGISIKPSAGMDEMKDDMGGAAAVMATMLTIAQLKLPVNVVGVMPCVENMPSGGAIRPGDVIKAASGKTIEVISTDAEGRMILADAVWYADTKLDADMIVDIATLTGAASIALGDFVSGLVCNNQDLCDKVLKAGIISGERCWQMPGDDEFKEYNKSDVADIKNSGGRSAGMITGGLFIGEFTNKPWVHIDIGNTVNNKSTKGYKVKGANGTGVRLLVEVAKGIV